MVWLPFSENTRRNYAKYTALFLAVVLLYSALFLKGNYSQIFNAKIWFIPIGFIIGALEAIYFYWYYNRGVM